MNINRNAREEITKRLSGTQGSALDALNRADYASDEDYLDACAKLHVERSSPEYAAAYRKVSAEYQMRCEKEQRKAQRARYDELSKTVTLDYVDKQNVERKAREAAQHDLAAKRITLDGMGAAIEKYAGQYTTEAKQEKTSRQLFNEMIRGQI